MTRQDPGMAKVLWYVHEGWPAGVEEALKPYWLR